MRTFNASVGKACKLCDKPFVEGDKSVLFPLPPEDPEEIAKMKEGKPYIVEGKEVHFLHLVDLAREFFPSVYAEWMG